MPSQACLDAIRKLPPPQNVPCPSAFCVASEPALDRYCHQVQLPPNTPVLQYDPDLNGPGKGGFCACCCNGCCYGIDLPLASQPGTFTLASDVVAGDRLLAAGPDLAWTPRRVQAAGGPGAEVVDGPAICVRVAGTPGATIEAALDLVVSDDQLFLLASGALRAADRLAPGDLLRRADGGTTAVVAVVAGTAPLRVAGIEMGAFDGTDLGGHLLNTAGLVTADFAVQVAYAAGRLSTAYLPVPSPEDPQLAVGSPGHRALFGAPPRVAWPAGFQPAEDA